MSDGTQTLTMAEALAEARAEMEPASSTDADTALPAEEAQAPAPVEEAAVVEGEQPAAEDSDSFSAEQEALAQALLDTGEDTQDGSGPGITPGSDEFWNLTLDVETVNGLETVTVQQMHDGFLMQKDYTQKTQALAEERKRLESAEKFLQAFEDDPAGFTRSLAIQAGFINEGDAPVRHVDVARIPRPEDLEQRVTSMVEERIANDPRIKQAEVSTARAAIETEFDRLQTEYKVPINRELRDDLIREATQRGTSDLEGLLTRRLVRAREARPQPASTARPGTPPPGSTQPQESAVGGDTPSMREAWQQAKIEAAAQQ